MLKFLSRSRNWFGIVALAILVVAAMLLAGCAGSTGPTGPQGPTGPAGPQGPAGPAGPAGTTATVTVTPTPTTPPPPVVVSAGKAQTADPGASVPLKVDTTINDGSTLEGVLWTQTGGTPATMSSNTSETISVTLADAAAYKAQLINGLVVPDRWGVRAITPLALDDAETDTFQVAVTTTSGTYTGTVTVSVAMPYIVNGGLENVAIDEPVLLQGKDQSAYEWTLTDPSGSTATLTEATTRFPSFTPDVTGKYTLTESKSGATFDIYAGTWAGAISGLGTDGLPVAAQCTICHNGTIAPDMFTSWRATGHANVIPDNLDTSPSHWSLACAPCHTVGDDGSVANGGFDKAIQDENWSVPQAGPGTWASIVKNYPEVAQFANIQCENCHGPNNSPAHANPDLVSARVSYSADVCGACHGEPMHHPRFQEWQLSSHANLDLAVSEATVENRGSLAGNCGRCHSAQGFLAWISQGNLTETIQGANGNATTAELSAMGLTVDSVQPQTCVTCHDPHDVGRTAATALVRIEGNTGMLPAGFAATNVGKGAICMVCHNTRNGLHNDDNPPTTYEAPHTPSQTDVLMGQNAFFVTPSQRSPHSLLKDTCVTCHMDDSPPPAPYAASGTSNHGFTASLTICSDCHSSALNGATLQAATKAKLATLNSAISDYVISNLPANVTVVVNGTSLNLDTSNIVSVTPTEIHGQEGFTLTLSTPVTVAGTSASSVQTNLSDITSGSNAVFAADSTIVKACWNYDLLNSDGSFGIHNPGWTTEVIDATLAALK